MIFIFAPTHVVGQNVARVDLKLNRRDFRVVTPYDFFKTRGITNIKFYFVQHRDNPLDFEERVTMEAAHYGWEALSVTTER